MKTAIRFFIMGVLVLGMFVGLNMIEYQPEFLWQGLGLLAFSFGFFCLLLYRVGLISLRPYLSSSLHQD